MINSILQGEAVLASRKEANISLLPKERQDLSSTEITNKCL